MAIPPSIVIAIIVVVIGIVIYILLKPGKKTGSRDLYADGLDMLVSGKRTAAYNAFKTIVENDTNHVNAYLKLGQVTREGDKPLQALKIHKSLLLRKRLTDYEQVELFKNLALDYETLNQISDAITETKKILQIDKRNEWALTHLVRFNREIREWEKAGNYLSQYYKVTGNPDTQRLGLYKIQEGRMAFKEKDYKLAIRKYSDALKIAPSLHEANYFIGNVHAAQSEHSFSIGMEAEESSHLSKKGMKTYKNAMDEAKGKLSSAVAEWTIYTKHDPVNAWLVLSKLRDALFALERFDEIEIILKNILSVAPDNVDAMESLANYYFQKGENTNASELAEQVIDMDETSIVANLIRLKIDVQTKESRALLQDIDRLIDLMSKDEDLHHQRQQIDSDIRWLFKSTGDLEKFRD